MTGSRHLAHARAQILGPPRINSHSAWRPLDFKRLHKALGVLRGVQLVGVIEVEIDVSRSPLRHRASNKSAVPHWSPGAPGADPVRP